MLQFIRDKTQGVTTWVIIIVICVSFAMFGISNYFVSDGKQDKVASVNGKPVTLAMLKYAYQQLLQQHQLAEQLLTDGEAQGYREIALQQLIQQTVLVQAAEAQGFLITDKEILDLLTQIPELQQDGRYVPERLQQMLQAIGMTQSQFFQSIRQKLLMTQVQESWYQSSFVLPNEVQRYRSLYYQTRDLQYVVIPKDDFITEASKVQFDQQSIEGFYQAHIAEYRQPATVKLAYVLLPVNDKDFTLKSDQLVNLSYESPDNLDVVATALNLPIKTTSYIGVAGDATDPIAGNPEVLRAAFSDDLVRDKYNSEVINLPSGDLVVVRVTEYIPEQAKPLAEVKTKIIQQMANQEARKLAYQSGQTLLASLSADVPLLQLARQKHYKHFSFQRVQRNADDINQQILQNLFTLPNQNLPQRKLIQLTNGNVVVVQLDAIHSAASNLSPEQESQMSQQLMDDFGKIEYALYQRTVSNAAEIKRYAPPSNDGEM